jgi:hypothetical protein
MGHLLLAVLVPADATVETIDVHLDRILEPRLGTLDIDDYRLGGGFTGAWDPGYDPTRDPANHETCNRCQGSQQDQGETCRTCADALDEGRAAGTILKWNTYDWASHPGDLVPLAHLYEPGWSFPPHRTPQAWVDLAGVRRLGTEERLYPFNTDTDIPPRLRRVLTDLRAGRRDPHGGPRRVVPVNADDWLVAVVDAHH